METIVVGVDGSESSLAALRWAIREARLRGARLVPLNAWSLPHVSTLSEAEHLVDVDFAPFREAARETLDAAIETTLPDGDGVVVDPVVVEGPAAAALLAAAADASLLVVGSRGHGGLKRLVLGSVSEECARHSPCPTVITRGA